MNEKTRKWHLDVISCHNQKLYDSLIYPHNISSQTLKIVEFNLPDEDEQKTAPLRGYFAVKDNLKYWIDEKLFDKLPIRITGDKEEFVYNEDLITHPP